MDSQFSYAPPSYYPPTHYPPNPNLLLTNHEIMPPSNVALRPPGVDSYVPLNSYQYPATHVGGYEAQASIAYGHHLSSQVGALPGANYCQDAILPQNWAAKDAVRQYGDYLPHAGYTNANNSVNDNSIYPTDLNNMSCHPLENGDIQRIPKETKALHDLHPVRCEVCKLDCNSKDVLDRHMLGKKHKRNMLSQEQKISPTIASLSKGKRKTKKRMLSGGISRQVPLGFSMLGSGEDMGTKRRKLLEGGTAADSVLACSMCNVVCNSQTVFNAHLAGRKHAVQAGTIPIPSTVAPANPVPNYWTNLAVQASYGKAKRTKLNLKKLKIVQSAWCEICSIDCSSQDVLNKHKLGKKHLKKLIKLNEARKIANTPASSYQTTNNPIVGPQENPSSQSEKITSTPASTTSATTSNPIIGPQENPSSNNGNTVETRKAKKKAASTVDEDVETKRQRVVSGGAAAEAVRICEACNVVCNSQSVFNLHIAGKKHASMVKKQAEASGTTIPGTQVVSID